MRANHQEHFTLIKTHNGNTENEIDILVKGMNQKIEEEVKNSTI